MCAGNFSPVINSDMIGFLSHGPQGRADVHVQSMALGGGRCTLSGERGARSELRSAEARDFFTLVSDQLERKA